MPVKTLVDFKQLIVITWSTVVAYIILMLTPPFIKFYWGENPFVLVMISLVGGLAFLIPVKSLVNYWNNYGDETGENMVDTMVFKIRPLIFVLFFFLLVTLLMSIWQGFLKPAPKEILPYNYFKVLDKIERENSEEYGYYEIQIKKDSYLVVDEPLYRQAEVGGYIKMEIDEETVFLTKEEVEKTYRLPDQPESPQIDFVSISQSLCLVLLLTYATYLTTYYPKIRLFEPTASSL